MTLLIAPWHWAPEARYPGSAIDEQYRVWDSAYVRNDVRRLDGVLSRGFTITTDHGDTTDRQTYLVSFRDAVPPKEYRTQMLRVTNSALRASVWTRETQRGADGARRVHYYLDTWISELGTWRLLNSRTLREEHR